MADQEEEPGKGISAETRRRAKIVARYADIERPTELDDERYAAELELSKDSLYRMAASWRAHRDPALFKGSRKRVCLAEAAQDEKLMASEIDLDGVHPTRRDETLRRIRAVQAYLRALPDADIDGAAHELGITTPHFRVVLRNWVLTGKAAAIPNATVPLRQWRKKQGARMRLREILINIVSAAGPDASVVSIFDRFVADAQAEGLKPLKIARVYMLVRELRSAAASSDAV